MEYLIGSISTILVFLVVVRTIRANQSKTRQIVIKSKTQAQEHSIIAPYLPIMSLLEPTPKIITQATKDNEKNYIRVVYNESKAYWIKDNSFMEADIVDGQVDGESTKVVDIMGMDKVQLDKMMFIVEMLTEGLTDDLGNPRNS